MDADRLTLAAIAIVAYTLATLVHEGIGHGGACLLSGAQALVVSSVHMECSVANRFISAGGTLSNFAAAALFFPLARRGRRSPSLRFFCWLFATINLMMAAGYFLFSGIGGFGDWAVFIQGLGPEWPLRIALVIIGGASYMASVRFSLCELRPMIGSDKDQRVRNAARLMQTPYFTGGTLDCIAGAMNPVGWYLVALSAAASTFGGTSGLVWAHHWLKDTKSIPLGPEAKPAPIERSWPWIAAAACVALIFVVVFGPGVRFH
jgi:hypothetical protein